MSKKKRPTGPGSYSERNKLIGGGRKAKRHFCNGRLLEKLKEILKKKKEEG